MASAGASSQSKEISTEFSKYYLALCPELRKLVMDHYIGAMGGLEPRIVEVRFDHPITETFTPTPLPEAVRNLLVVSIETRAMVERDYPLAFQIGGHGSKSTYSLILDLFTNIYLSNSFQLQHRHGILRHPAMGQRPQLRQPSRPRRPHDGPRRHRPRDPSRH